MKIFPLEIKKKYCIGNFKVQCLLVPHGDTPCYSFIIDHECLGRVLFITDCSTFPYNVKGINHLLIESNYMTDIIEDNAVDNIWNSSASNTHMEISTTIEVVKRHYSSDLMATCLLHLSNGNSDKYKFKKMITDEVGIIPYIAEPNLIIELNKEEF